MARISAGAVEKGRAPLVPRRSVSAARALWRARDPGSRPRRRTRASRLFRRGVARAAGRSPRRRLRGPHPRRPLQRRGTPLAPRARAPALGRAGSGRRRRTTPRGLGRRPYPGRGRPGPPRCGQRRSYAHQASRPSVPVRQDWTGRSSLARGDTPGPPLLAYVDLSEWRGDRHGLVQRRGHARLRKPPRRLRRGAGARGSRGAGRARSESPTSAATRSARP